MNLSVARFERMKLANPVLFLEQVYGETGDNIMMVFAAISVLRTEIFTSDEFSLKRFETKMCSAFGI